jgi:glycosyltransferase involved in cell wall biosynthesis
MSAAAICLNMIVKNETSNLPRCLASVAPYIARYVLCDTGSVDGTPDYVRRYFAERAVPGAVIEIPFETFEQARNAALAAARTNGPSGTREYLLLCDADMELVVQAPAVVSSLAAPVYAVIQRTETGLEYPNVRLLRADVQASYSGGTHEVLRTPGHQPVLLRGCHFLDHACGANRAEKQERDIRLLCDALERDPNDARSVFYLANSYFDTTQYDRAIAQYERRIALGGWAEEVFYSRYRIGLAHLAAGRSHEGAEALLAAYAAHPHRAEPLHALARHFLWRRQWCTAHHYARIASAIPEPEDGLFVETQVYARRLREVMAICEFWLGRRPEEPLAAGRS